MRGWLLRVSRALKLEGGGQVLVSLRDERRAARFLDPPPPKNANNPRCCERGPPFLSETPKRKNLPEKGERDDE